MGDNPVVSRQVDFTLTRKMGDDGVTLEGYAAVFGSPTRIDSYEGTFDEVIARGAFAKTLNERGDKVVLQFDHGAHPFVGSMPIGRINTLEEDERGLFVSATLFDNDLVKPIRQAIEAGAISGMSFRFQVMGEKWDDDERIAVRTVTEVKLFEVGPVVFPAYDDTSVGIRAAEIVQLLRTDSHLRDQVATGLIASAPETSAGPDGATGDEGRTSKDDAATVHVDRSADHKTVVGRISNYVQEDAA